MSNYYKIALIGTVVVCVGILGVWMFRDGGTQATDDLVMADPAPELPAQPQVTAAPTVTAAAQPNTAAPAATPNLAPPTTVPPVAGPVANNPRTAPASERSREDVIRENSRFPDATPVTTTAEAPATGWRTETLIPVTTATTSVPGAGGFKTYTIQPGDMLSRIARREYGNESMWVEITRANPTIDPHRLQVGQTIRLPSASGAAERQGSAANIQLVSAPAAGNPGTGATQRVHVVRSGETLFSIARQYYRNAERWQLIHAANRSVIGANPDRIAEGMRLVIPVENPVAR